MAEDVDKEESFARLGLLVGLEPRADLVEKLLVVLHVLHHLDRKDSVKAARD